MSRERGVFRSALQRVLDNSISPNTPLQQIGITSDSQITAFLGYVEEKAGLGSARPLSEDQIVRILEAEDEPDLRRMERFFLKVYREENPTVGHVRRALAHMKRAAVKRFRSAAAGEMRVQSTPAAERSSANSNASVHTAEAPAEEDSDEHYCAPGSLHRLAGGWLRKNKVELTAEVKLVPSALPAHLIAPLYESLRPVPGSVSVLALSSWLLALGSRLSALGSYLICHLL